MLYSNEIVFRGHPDKVCDQISDRLLDEFLKEDKNSRCAIEVMGSKNKIFISGEITSNAKVDISKTTKEVLKDVGYDEKVEIIVNLSQQSKDISMGVDLGGAGDNGMMFGYAVTDNDKFLPTAMVILQEFSKEYDDLRKKDNRFKSDGKAQITGLYDSNNNLKAIKYFTICYQNTEKNRLETDKILKEIANKIALKYGVLIIEFLINPTGKFEIGGFTADTGLTGRKIIVDTYQSFAKHGGGAFSGKDPSKVDRSGAYMARKVAKEILIKNKLLWCEVNVSYAIGIKRPLNIKISSNIGLIEADEELYNRFVPQNIIKELDLLNISYYELSQFGHFKD